MARSNLPILFSEKSILPEGNLRAAKVGVMGPRSLAEPHQLVAAENVPNWFWLKSLALLLQAALQFVGDLISLLQNFVF